ncbi:MAG: LOG family protein [Leptolinea sp.]|nr:LOG family protein [Leptolinea sp.]
MKVAVFGGANAHPGEPDYDQALLLGAGLARSGHMVMTGGYIGVMEAVSKGAAEVGGHVIGVTCDEIEAFRPIKPNKWVKEEWRFISLSERMMNLINRCDAAVALPGGVGTLAEISVLWNQMLVHAVPKKPAILVGDGWKEIVDCFFTAQNNYIAPQDHELLAYAPDIQTVLEFLNGAHHS